MITLHYETHDTGWQPAETWDSLPPLTQIDMTTHSESLDSVLEDIERFLRAVYGWIPADAHLVLEEPTE
jgi:hypothetical protein